MKKAGYRILARNLRLSMGEIDILCQDPTAGTIVLVEVKARQQKPGDTKQVDPEASITAAKKKKLRTLARVLIKQNRFANCSVRIDVIAVVFDEGIRKPAAIRHYESAI